MHSDEDMNAQNFYARSLLQMVTSELYTMKFFWEI